MKGHFLVRAKKARVEKNIYADKSALVLEWLLRVGINKEELSIRLVANEIEVSVGLVQKVFKTLVLKGILQAEGVRTAKQFVLKKPELLLKSWLENYSLIKKCKMWTYRSGFQGKSELLDVLKRSSLSQKVALALHSAAEALDCKNTNLDTLELYMLDSSTRLKLENLLDLESQERGYEVLLIEPYYKSWLSREEPIDGVLKRSSALLTYLDLFHFPLRGQEQAEYMAQKLPDLKRICSHDD